MSLSFARDMLDGMMADDLRHPRIDRTAVVKALGEFLVSYRQELRPIWWFDDPVAARDFVAPLRLHRAYVSDPAGMNAALFDVAWGTIAPRRLSPRHGSRSGFLPITPAPFDETRIPDRFVRL